MAAAAGVPDIRTPLQILTAEEISPGFDVPAFICVQKPEIPSYRAAATALEGSNPIFREAILVGCLTGLDLASRSSLLQKVTFVSCSRREENFWIDASRVFYEETDGNAAEERIKTLIQHNWDRYFEKPIAGRRFACQMEHVRYSLFTDPARYARIHRIFLERKVFFQKINLFYPGALRSLTERTERTAFYYLANVSQLSKSPIDYLQFLIGYLQIPREACVCDGVGVSGDPGIQYRIFPGDTQNVKPPAYDDFVAKMVADAEATHTDKSGHVPHHSH